MIKTRYANLYEKRQDVINAIVNCTNKKSFLETGDYHEFTVPYHTMLLDALTASLPQGEVIRTLNNNIALLDGRPSDTAVAKIHKQVQMTATIFFSEDIAELDEVGFFDFREPTIA